MRTLEKYEYSLTVTKMTKGWLIQIDNTPYNKTVSNPDGMTTGMIVSNLGAFLNYLYKLK